MPLSQAASAEIERKITAALQHHQTGRFGEAEQLYRAILALDPNHADSLHLLGLLAHQLGHNNAAVELITKATALRPHAGEYHMSLGLAQKAQGQFAQAEASYRRVLALKPDFAEAHNNLGNVLFPLGKRQDAVAAWRQALALKPDLVTALNTLGAALYEMGQMDEAALVYVRLVAMAPNDASALNRLAAVLALRGDTQRAMTAILRSLEIGESEETKRLFTDIVKHCSGATDQIRAILAQALSEAWARPEELAEVSARLIRERPLALEGEVLASLAHDGLLCALLRTTQNTDIELERFLTRARRRLLEMAASGAADAGLEFYVCLALQCFINEYVFALADDEMRDAKALRDRLAAALEQAEAVPVLWVVAVAAYFPLSSLPAPTRLLDQAGLDAARAILVQQITEPAEEEILRAAIPAITPIADRVSQLVQSQYEENPYPRWVKLPAAAPTPLEAYLRQRFTFSPLKIGKGDTFTAILVAGCGTGQQSIEVAQSTGGRILAVDLSLSSLGYAKRKSQELGLTNIEYAQGDILELGALDRRFDAVECTGVLHHLADPYAGWRVLNSLLRPGGVMHIGLYSALARRDVTRARAFIAERGYGASAAEIRRCRQDLLVLDEREKFRAVTSGDFFGVSMCRDLLFHVQEHQMDLGSIAGFLKENGLNFLGFEIGRDVLLAYRRFAPDDTAATDLKSWQGFEEENPDSFAAMYNFWVQKVP